MENIETIGKKPARFDSVIVVTSRDLSLRKLIGTIGLWRVFSFREPHISSASMCGRQDKFLWVVTSRDLSLRKLNGMIGLWRVFLLNEKLRFPKNTA